MNLASNAANVTFGALTVTPDASQRGLLATENAGALTVPSGTVATTGATAVEITRSAGTTPLSVSLTTVNANGGSNGIYLRRTSGSFAVVGSGSAGSGGTIRNMTGADGAVAGSGIYLDNATNVSLSRLQLNDFQNFAIRGLTVSGFTLANSVINGVNGNGAAADEGSVSFSELTGSASVSSTSISGGFEDNFRVVNTSGTLNRITFSTVTIGANSTTDGNDGIVLEALTGAAILNATIQSSTFTSARGDLFNFLNNGTATCDLVFTGNTLTNNHPAIATGGGGVTISGGDLGGSLAYNITGNSFRDSDGNRRPDRQVDRSGDLLGVVREQPDRRGRRRQLGLFRRAPG